MAEKNIKKKTSPKKKVVKNKAPLKSSAKTGAKKTIKKSSAKILKSTQRSIVTKQKPDNKKKNSKNIKSKKKNTDLKPVEQENGPDEEFIDPKASQRGDSPMSVVGHLDELRSRFVVSLLTIIILTMASFFFSEYILDVIEKPFQSTGHKLNIFNITEGFLLRLKASLIAGIFLGMPVLIYELWKYIRPAINADDRRFAKLSIIAGILLFFGGISLTYFLILPFALQMLISFIPEGMQSVQNASNYLSFVLLFSIAMGILFELPILILILTRIGIVTPEFLIRKRKYAIVLIFVIAAMITPPDVLTQLMLGLPLILLYEISIVISKFVVIRKKKKELQRIRDAQNE